MGALDTLLQYFPAGTAEGEEGILDQVFILPSQMAELISAPAASPRLMIGNKGVGKSAILFKIKNTCDECGIPALIIRPDDIDLTKVQGARDIATLKRTMYQSLLFAVGQCLGRIPSGLLTGPAAELHQLLVEHGKKPKDLVQRLLGALSAIAKPVIQIDAEMLATGLAGGRRDTPLLPAIKSYLKVNKSIAMLLIDDTDQVASPDELDQLNRIWAFLLALRRICQEAPAIHVIVSLRSEVWARLQQDERGQREQIDHFRALVTSLRVEDEHLSKILERRIDCAAYDVDWHEENRLDPFFESAQVLLPGGKREPWLTFIKRHSRTRPRDMVQLVNHVVKSAQRRGASLIGDRDREDALRCYSQERISDLSIEVGRDCPRLEDVARTFSGFESLIPFYELREHMLTIPSRFGVHVRGRSVEPHSKEGFVRLLSVLFESGFLLARRRDRDGQPTGPIKHYQDPSFVSEARWNELQGTAWEVHPAFQAWLRDIRQNGLAS